MAASCSTPSRPIFSTRNAFRSTPSAFRRFRSGRPLLKETKQVVINVYSGVREDSSLTIKAALAETVRLTGLSVATIRRIKAENKTHGKVRSPIRRSLDFGRRTKRLDHFSKLDDFEKNALTRTVHSFFSRNEIPTLQKVLKAIEDDGSFLQKFNKTSLHKAMKHLGFKFQRRKRNSALISRPELIEWRSMYLKAIRLHRSTGRPIYFLDETWVNAGHTKDKVWHDTTVLSARSAWSSGLTVGLSAPSGKGTRLIITHAGNEDGFVPGALDIFEGKKGSGDYHEEMDGNRFERWFVDTLLPKIKPNSVIVMDNASYHSVRLEKIPTTKTKKADIQQWLTSKGILWTPQLRVVDLLALVAPVRSQYTTYNVDNRAEEAGHTVLRLPPYHCELNPIELIWSQVKGHVARENKTFKLADVRILLAEGINNVSVEDWANSVKHVVDKVEPNFWKLDGLTVTDIEPFIISLDGDSDTSDEDSEAAE